MITFIVALVDQALLVSYLASGPAASVEEARAWAEDTLFVSEVLLWLVLSSITSKLLVGLSLIAAGLLVAGFTWVVYPVSTEHALRETAGVAPGSPATSRFSYHAIRLVRRFAKVLCFFGLLLLGLVSLLTVGLHGPPPLAQTCYVETDCAVPTTHAERKIDP